MNKKLLILNGNKSVDQRLRAFTVGNGDDVHAAVQPPALQLLPGPHTSGAILKLVIVQL